MSKSKVLFSIIEKDINLIKHFKTECVKLHNFELAAKFRDMEVNFDYSTEPKTECGFCKSDADGGIIHVCKTCRTGMNK